MGKVLVVSFIKDSQEIQAQHKLTDSEFELVSESIQYLLLLCKKDSLFIRHALNYIDLFDTINHARNTSDTGDVPDCERIEYPQYLFSKSFFAPFIFTELERVIGNYLSSSRTFFEVRMSKEKYIDFQNNNTTILFIHHYRNYFQHQEVSINISTIGSLVDSENKKLIANCSLIVPKIDFHDSFRGRKRTIIRESELPDSINVFSFINEHMTYIVNHFYDLYRPDFSSTKTKEAFDTLLPYVDDSNNISEMKIKDTEDVSINKHELIFLKNIFYELIMLPIEPIKWETRE